MLFCTGRSSHIWGARRKLVSDVELDWQILQHGDCWYLFNVSPCLHAHVSIMEIVNYTWLWEDVVVV